MAGPETIRVDATTDLAETFAARGIPRGRPVLVVVGGAAGMSDGAVSTSITLLLTRLAPVLDRCGAVVMDGGTDAGVMRLLGEVRTRTRASFPLIGVAAAGTVALPGTEPEAGTAAIEESHTHLILVPGHEWGDESPWLTLAAQVISAEHRSVTLLINGGAITLRDARNSLSAGHPVIVLNGSGRTADEIARARTGGTASAPAAEIAKSPLTHIIPLTDYDAITDTIERLLT
ncbi:hypothetical protein [Nocardia sp. NPDC057030]|uniref:hypothetical protein n=1 Tax=unclassified Nocardia TaxID=2637762 RepID=UPI003628F681